MLLLCVPLVLLLNVPCLYIEQALVPTYLLEHQLIYRDHLQWF
jgi:hypothetical protein